MKLCISNIAWTQEYNEDILAFLAKENVLLETTKMRCPSNRNAAAMQSIIYPNEVLADGLDLAGHYAAEYGIKTLVLGAPKHKNVTNPNDFIPIFRTFAAKFPKTILAIEAVAPIYGGNVLSSNMELQNLISLVQCYNVGICFDTENFRLSGYDMMPSMKNSIKHVHIAPNFHKEDWDWKYIRKCVSNLTQSEALSTDILSIEMFEKDFFSICKSIKEAKKELKEWLD